MNCSNIHCCAGQIQNSFRSLLLRCGTSFIRQRRQVHPEISYPEDLEFVHLDSQRIIRVLHVSQKSTNNLIKPDVKKRNKNLEFENGTISKQLDVSAEEYWFTRSNRPFKMGEACDCIPNMYESCDEFPQTSRHCMPGVSNELIRKSSGGFHLKCFDNEFGNNPIEKFADNFAKVLINEVIIHSGNQIKLVPTHNTCVLKYAVLNFVPVCESSTSNGVRRLHNLKNVNQTPDGTIINVPRDQNIKPVDIKPTDDPVSDDSNDIFQSSNVTCYGGIVNLSFSGTVNEPDALFGNGCENSLEDNSPRKDIVHKKLETSKGGNEIWEDIDIRKSSSPEKQHDQSSSSMNGELINTSREPDYFFPKEVNEDNSKAKESFSDEEILDSFAEVRKPQGNRSEKNVPFSLSSSLTDLRNDNMKINDKMNQDCCKHAKNTQKPLLLFLHGAGSSADVWSVLLEYFSSAGYEVLAPDMLGHGYSSAPDNRAAYTFDKLLQDILQIFDKFVSDHQKCIVIGHSYGSCFAAALARYRPQQVVQLVLLSSGGPSPLVPKQAFFSLPSCVMSFMKPFLMCGFKRDMFYAPRGKHLAPSCTYELPPYVLKHVECGQEWSDGDSAFHRRILVPTLLVHGLKDPHITLVEECEMERTIPRSFLEVISNAGHMVMLDTPDQLCHMIHSFITWWSS